MTAPSTPAFGRRNELDENEPDPVSEAEKARALKRIDLMDIDERRDDQRKPAFRGGEIDLPDGRTVGCILRNFSETGCRLKLAVDEDLPDRFNVRVDNDGSARPAEVVWREHGALGVKFLR
ncbi:MAG: PilZ domain-containing protein [Parvularculaceae bacterium]|nr:PilZ domain-containing protein [Parvularculaceae bacterium]